MYSKIEELYYKHKRWGTGVQIVDSLHCKAGLFYIGDERRGKYLIKIKDHAPLPDQIQSLLHEFLHLEPPFINYIQHGGHPILESAVELETEKLYKADPEGVELLEMVVRFAYEAKPNTYFLDGLTPKIC